MAESGASYRHARRTLLWLALSQHDTLSLSKYDHAHLEDDSIQLACATEGWLVVAGSCRSVRKHHWDCPVRHSMYYYPWRDASGPLQRSRCASHPWRGSSHSLPLLEGLGKQRLATFVKTALLTIVEIARVSCEICVRCPRSQRAFGSRVVSGLGLRGHGRRWMLRLVKFPDGHRLT